MIKEIIHDPIFLGQKSELATKQDREVSQDLLDTLIANKDVCVGMAANMIGVKKCIIAFDNNGEYMTEAVKVENGFVGVYSLVNIKLPNRVERNGVKRDYKPTKGYNFIHSVETEMGTKYLYTVPMEVVYPLDLCALVISLNKHKAYYKGCKIALTTGHYVYIYSIPYKYRENSGYKLIGAKPNPDFDKEMDELLKYWVNENILFDLKLTELQGNFDGNKNLGYQHLPGTRAYGDYVKTNKHLEVF